MPWPRPRWTVRRLMALVAIAAVELAMISMLRDGAGQAALQAPVETAIQLAFLNLLIAGPAWVFLRARR